MYLQHLDQDGNILWETDGLLISDNPSMSWLTDWDMKSDFDNNAILTFQDVRNTNNDVFVYKISNTGEFLWGEDGIELSQEGFNVAPVVEVLPNNSVVVAWSGEGWTSFKCLDSDGIPLSGVDEIVLQDDAGEYSYSWPQIVAIDNDTFILKYYQDSGPTWAPTRHIFAQKYNTYGETVWDEPAVISNAGGISSWTQNLPIEKDSNNGFYISWHDDRDSDNDYEAFVQHVNGDGSVVFNNGLDLSNQESFMNFGAKLTYDSEEDALYIIYSATDMNQNARGIHGQKLQNDQIVWSDAAEIMVPLVDGDTSPLSVAINNDELLVLYQRGPFGSINSNIYAMRYDTNAESIWDEAILIKNSETPVGHPEVITTSEFQHIAVWEEEGTSTTIKAQNINWDGSLGVASPVTAIEGTIILSNDNYFVTDVVISINDDVYSPNESGEYYFEYTPGIYSITFSHPNYEIVEEEINLIEGEVLTIDVSLTDELISGVSGTVTLSNQEFNIEEVVIIFDGEEYSTQTDGSYSIQHEPGNYDIVVSHPNYVSITQSVEITLGQFTTVDVNLSDVVSNEVSEIVTSLSIYPNPVSKSSAKNVGTKISFSNPKTGRVEIQVYNIKGQLVDVITNEIYNKGNHVVNWNCSDNKNKEVATGVYFININTQSTSQVKKITVMK
jgi:hypothetical protein